MSTRPEPTAEQRQAFDDLLREAKELRPLPAIALRLIAMVEDSRFSAQDLAGTIRTDQALTLKILRLANSSTFGLPRRITSLREAIVLLGFREVRSLALGACVVDASVRDRIAGATLDYETFWVNSLVVAYFAQALAEAEGVDSDEAFTGGVVHNVGRLALAQHRPDWLREAVVFARAEGMTVQDAEAHLLGFTDSALGAAIARSWSFPPVLVEAVERHAWQLSQLGAANDLDVVVAKARRFARSHCVSDGVDVVGHPLAPDRDWQLPRVKDALRQVGGVAGVLDRARAFLAETAA